MLTYQAALRAQNYSNNRWRNHDGRFLSVNLPHYRQTTLNRDTHLVGFPFVVAARGATLFVLYPEEQFVIYTHPNMTKMALFRLKRLTPIGGLRVEKGETFWTPLPTGSEERPWPVERGKIILDSAGKEIEQIILPWSGYRSTFAWDERSVEIAR